MLPLELSSTRPLIEKYFRNKFIQDINGDE